MNPYRILVVEDEAIVAMDVQDRLASLGYELAGRAASGEQALALAEQQRPDLVLMDIRLQGDMDGITAAEQMRQRFHVPVIFLTAYSEDATLARAKLAEPFGYILKPFDDRELKSSIEIALYRHQAEQEIRRLTRLYDLLSEVNQAIVRTPSREELLPLVCRLVVERGEADLAWISWRDAATGAVKPITHFGEAADLLSQADFGASVTPAPLENPGAATQEDAPFVCNNCGGSPCVHPSTQAPARFGFQSFGSFPLRSQGQVCGTLNLCVAEPGFFRERELELLKEVASDLSLALDRIEAEAQRQRVKAALRESEERYRTLFEDATEGIALADAQTGEILDCNRAFLRLSGYERDELIGRPQSMLHPKTEGSPSVSPTFAEHRDGKPGAVLPAELVIKSGQRKHVEIKANVLELGGRRVLHGFFRDVTAELRYQHERETSLKLLRLLNDHNHTRELVRNLTGFLQEWTGCEAVGVRLQEGDDFPYFETRGFPPEFVEAENQLCVRDERGQLVRDNEGHPLLECMCGNVLCGRFNPASPFFTPNGSFWTNSTTELLAAATEADHQGRTRNRCYSDGYESVALIPLRFGGQTLGLLQLNDRAPGRFTPELITYLEEAAGQIAIALAQRQTQAELRESEAKYRLVSENTADVIWLYDLESSRFTYVSPSVYRLCGVTPEQARQQAMEDVLTPASLRVVTALLPARIAALEAGDESVRVQMHEVEQLRRDGSIVPTEVVTTLLQNTAGRVVQLIGVSRDITERRQTELALRQSQAQLAAIHDHAPIVMLLLDKERRVRRMNRAALEFLKRPEGQAEDLRPGDVLGCVHALDDPRGCGHGKDCAHCPLRLTMLDTLTTGASHQRVEVKPSLVAGKGARDLTMLASTARLSIEGEPMLLLCLEDITDRRRLESQFRQAQKMEAVGQLAGGVAHDFNNILTGILIELGMVKDHPQLPEPLAQSMHELERAANRAAALTRQLLLFSRREVMQARPLNLNELLDNMLKMLRRLLGEHITVNFQSQVDLPQVEADTGMIEQVVMNLCVNARDAMPQGGRLTIAVKPARIEAAEVTRHPDARAGDFVSLSVEDTGCGMSEAVQARIFEPFFTTKEVGRGTGLGLATVFGIVQQHQGWIEVSSAVGQGSTFAAYLPVFAGPAAASPVVEATESIRGGKETILVVEDEPGVRQLARLVLQRQGYAVIEAANGIEALRLWSQHRERIDLLFSDMVMPEGLTGQELAGRLRAEKPDLKVILSSGYSAELIEGGGWKIKGAVYLPKPYSLDSLARTVRECLDQ